MATVTKKTAKNYQHIVAVLPTGDWAEIGTFPNEEVTFYTMSDAEFKRFQNDSENTEPYDVGHYINGQEVVNEIFKRHGKTLKA